MFKKLIAGLITAVLSLGAVALIAGPASAHHNTINPTVTCATSGAYTVTWAVTNSESAKTEVITQSNLPGVVAVGESFAFSETRNFTQSVDSPQDITLTLTGFWQDGNVYSQNSGSISKGSFPTGCLKVTAGASQEQSKCDATTPFKYSDPTYTLAIVTGVEYVITGDANPTAGGTFPATNGITININAQVTDPKYQLQGTTSWSFSFNAPAAPCTVKTIPAPPEFKQPCCTDKPGESTKPRYFIPEATGVLYGVKFDGVESNVAADSTPGWHNVDAGVKTVQVIARADALKGYTIDGDPVLFDLWTIIPAGDCLKLIPPKEPEWVQAACKGDGFPGEVIQPSYTLIPVEHIVYLISTNGVDFVPATNVGTKQDVAQGATIWIQVTVDDPTKYQAGDITDKVLHFDTPGDCKHELTPKEPDPKNQFCDDSDPLHPFLVDATIEIIDTPGVRYFIDGAVAQVGLNKVSPGHHVVTFEVEDPAKYFLNPDAKPFPFDITPGKCLPTYPDVIPAAASSQIGCFTPGSYTLSNNLNDVNAVIWTVNGSQVSPGKYTVTNAGTVTIAATPNAPVYGFQTGIQTTWTVNFAKPAVCDVETLAMTGQSPTGLLIAADFLVVAGLALFAARALRRGRFQMG